MGSSLLEDTATRGRIAWRARTMLPLVLLGACSLSGLDERYGLVDGGPGGDGCVPIENCTNGVDDDCNGLVDCADPTCKTGGFTCTAAAIPSGWALVGYSATTRPVCPPSYGAEQAVISNVGGAPATCSCVCTGGPAVCGGTALYNGYPNSCATNATPVTLGVSNGACATTTATLTANDSYQLYFASVPQAQQGTCNGAGKVTASLAPTLDPGATCAGPPKLGAGCAAGVCAPPTGAAFKTCITHPGSVACPTFGFTQQTLASTASPGYVDTRACGPCPCATSLACDTVTSVAVFTNGTCAGSPALDIDPTCKLASVGASIQSYKVAFPTTGDPTCKPTGSSPPTGGVSLDSKAETICCAP